MLPLPKSQSQLSPKVRILIVDDHSIVRRGLAMLIGDQPDLEVCGEAASIPEALALAKETKPQLAIIDLTLGEGNGLSLIKTLKALDPALLVLVCSMHDEELFAERALHAGALGYVEKGESDAAVVDAIRCLLEGRVYLSASMNNRLVRSLVGRGQVTGESPLKNLSDREVEVLEMIGHGQTSRQIADKLHLSVHTIESHRENLKRKLKLESGVELTRYAVQWVLDKS